MLDMNRIIQEINGAHDFSDAMKIMVKRVREIVETEACTIYIVDQKRKQFVLFATDGLNPAVQRNLRVGLNEGLVGYVGKREEPINLDDAPSHPSFAHYAIVGEDRFKAFLGVPILHRRKLYGVIVLQQEERRKYDEGEAAFIGTLAALLASTIAHAEISGSLYKALAGSEQLLQEAYYEGIPSSSGVAIGKAVIIYPSADLDAVPDKSIKHIHQEIENFNNALIAAREDIKRLAHRISANLPEQERALFDVYERILDSTGIGDEVIEEINKGNWAQGALRIVVKRHIRNFKAMDDVYLRERADDIKDLGLRVLSHLQEKQDDAIEYPAETILIGDDVTASALADVPEGQLAGVVSSRGSANSHVAILARALGVPAVMGAAGLSTSNRSVTEMQDVIVDGYYGQVYVTPSPTLLKQFTTLAKEEQELDISLEDLHGLPAVTPDGYHISLFVNTGLAADASMSLTVGAEGVGLFRSEVPFMVKDRFPSEQEQKVIYRQLLNAFSPRPVIMRTLDVGGDKPLPYFNIEEENPFLGWRGIRLTLDQPDIFLVQLRAMLKASEGFDNLHIMLPMITSMTELDEALELIDQAYQEVLEEGIEITRPPIGAMIEVPSAVYQAKSLARRLDFLSVGSNDLVQYLLAVDRNNARVARLYDPLHPAVLKALKQVVDAAHSEGKQVSLCGEMASDPVAVILLIAMGFDALSMSSVVLPRIKWVIRSIPMKQAKEVLEKVMPHENPAKTRFFLEQLLEEAGLGGLIRAGK